MSSSQTQKRDTHIFGYLCWCSFPGVVPWHVVISWAHNWQGADLFNFCLLWHFLIEKRFYGDFKRGFSDGCFASHSFLMINSIWFDRRMEDKQNRKKVEKIHPNIVHIFIWWALLLIIQTEGIIEEYASLLWQ